MTSRIHHHCQYWDVLLPLCLKHLSILWTWWQKADMLNEGLKNGRCNYIWFPSSKGMIHTDLTCTVEINFYTIISLPPGLWCYGIYKMVKKVHTIEKITVKTTHNHCWYFFHQTLELTRNWMVIDKSVFTDWFCYKFTKESLLFCHWEVLYNILIESEISMMLVT